MDAKRLTPNSIANLVMADDAWHDSEYVAAADYDALLAERDALRAEVERLRDSLARARLDAFREIHTARGES